MMRQAFRDYAAGAAPQMSSVPQDATVPTPRLKEALPQPRLVALGGGNGLSTLLRGLRPLYFPSCLKPPTGPERDALTAIVTSTSVESGNS